MQEEKIGAEERFLPNCDVCYCVVFLKPVTRRSHRRFRALPVPVKWLSGPRMPKASGSLHPLHEFAYTINGDTAALPVEIQRWRKSLFQSVESLADRRFGDGLTGPGLPVASATAGASSVSPSSGE